MKSLKLKVISSLIAATLIVPAVAVHAEGTNTNSSTIGSGLVKYEQNLQNREQRQQFKAAMSQKKDTIKKNYETNQGLRKTIADKRATIKTTIKDIKQNNKQLTSEDLAKIESQSNVIKADTSSLEATKGTIKTAFDQFKTDVQNKNYDAASSQLDNVISIQNTRTSDLTKLSSDLDSLINLLQTATTTDVTQPAQSGA